MLKETLVSLEVCRKDPTVEAFHSMFSTSQTSWGGRNQSDAARVSTVWFGVNYFCIFFSLVLKL